jgi:hypothetical protein
MMAHMTSTRLILLTSLMALLATSAADAAPAKRKRGARRPVAVKAAPPPKPPALPVTPGIMVPKAVTLTKPTPAETRAHAVWMLRAGLNVAALQCQYSPFLRSVDNYNQMLRKHGADLISAQDVLIKHFTRTVKKGGLAAFDRYNTRSYNSFSTLDAQYNFCWSAGQAGLAARMAPPGALANVAAEHVPLMRAALAWVPPAAGLKVPDLVLPNFAALDPISDSE